MVVSCVGILHVLWENDGTEPRLPSERERESIHTHNIKSTASVWDLCPWWDHKKVAFSVNVQNSLGQCYEYLIHVKHKVEFRLPCWDHIK